MYPEIKGNQNQCSKNVGHYFSNWCNDENQFFRVHIELYVNY